MGFSVSVAGGILFIGLLFSASLFTQTYLTTQNRIQESMRVAEYRLEAGRQARLDINNVTYSASPQRLWVNATNNGSVTFNLTTLDVVIDGVVRSTDIQEKQVDGAVTNVWPPESVLRLRIAQTTGPSSVQVVAPNGAQAFWRS